jgi:hypothetical protein
MVAPNAGLNRFNTGKKARGHFSGLIRHLKPWQ